jgi:hypothetical protein
MFNNKYYDNFIPTKAESNNYNMNNDMFAQNKLELASSFNSALTNNNLNNFNSINKLDDSYKPNNLLDINKLHKEIEKREERKNKVYEMILHKVHMRIVGINKKSSDCYCFFVVPSFIFGVPLYDMNNCIIYVMKDLTDRGFKVEYTHPNLLYINWISKPKEIKSKKNIEYKIINDIPDNSLIYHPQDFKKLEEKTDIIFDI